MLALSDDVFEPVWTMIQARLPHHVPRPHPLGCHRRRIPDRVCFNGIISRLVTGSSWDVAARFAGTSESTLTRRFNEWIAADVFSGAVEEALAAFDTVIGFRLDNVAVDASQHKAPTGGECCGPNMWDRAKLGWKWTIITEASGVPIGWTIDAANRPDAQMLEGTLEEIRKRGLLHELGCMHLDKGYSYQPVRDLCASYGLTIEMPERTKRPKTGQGRNRARRAKTKFKTEPHRWQVERTNSWMTNFGQLRRSTDRKTIHRLTEIQLAMIFIITVKLVKHIKRFRAITRRPY